MLPAPGGWIEVEDGRPTSRAVHADAGGWQALADPAGAGGPAVPASGPGSGDGGSGAGDEEAAQHRPGFQAGDVLLILLGLLVLLTFAPQLWLAVDTILGGEGIDQALRTIDLWLSAAVLILMGALAFFWVLSTRNEPLRGTILYLRLHDPWRSLAWGVGLGFALVLALVLVGLLLGLVWEEPENPALEDLAKILTWPLAITLSLAAAFGEEMLFRGLLQRWITVWGQAAVFGLLHAYQGVYGVLLTFALGLLFGFMVRRGGSLWIPIAAHFTFNMVQMAALIFYAEGA